MTYAYDRPKAMTDLAAMADRNRPHWTWQAEGRWLYVPPEGMWRAVVKAGESGFEWSFLAYPGRVRVPGGESPDMAIMYRAVKTGPQETVVSGV